MTKTKKSNFILVLAAILFAALAALLIISPKTVVKADEPDTPVYSNYTQQEQFAVGAKLAGKLVVICGDYSELEPGDTIFLTENPDTYVVSPTAGVLYTFENSSMNPTVLNYLTSSEIAEISAATGIENISAAFVFPDVSDTGIPFTDISVSLIESNPGLEFYLFSYVATSGNNGGEQINPLPNETENKFDLSEWLHNAGENVSVWLGENVGISVTGGTVLIVGAVIIFLTFRRRRR
ncbi:MAG: hypothetical protein IJQ23_07950 [Clostridia bacterium]|nr:hypothetical protein [Clostridia bacterium]